MNIGQLTISLGVDASGLVVAQTAMRRLETTMVTSLNTMSQRLRTFGYLAGAAITVPMVLAAKSSMNMAKEFEFSMQKIVGLTGTAQSVVNEWEQDVLQLSKKFGKSPQELAEALYFISSSGIKGAEAMNVLSLSAKAAASGLGQTQDVANLLTSALNAYRGTGLQASYVTDTLVAAVREGKAEADGFASAMGQIIPIAAQAGVSFDQVAGAMAAITLTGSTASNAAVYLKGIFNSLQTASAQGETALNGVNSSYAELRHILREQGLIALMQKIRDITIGNEEALSDILPNIRALTGYLSIAGKNFKYNSEMMQRVTNSAGTLGAAWAAVADTIKIKYDKAISTAQVSMIKFGKIIIEQLLPIFERLVEWFTKVIDKFESLTEAQKESRIKFLLWVAAAGPIALTLSIIGYSISGLIGLLSGLTNILVAINPWMVAIGAAALFVGWVIKLSNKAKETAKEHNKLNDVLIKVGGTMKKLSELTPPNYSTMSLSELSAANATAYAAAKVAHDEFYRLEKLRKEFPRHERGYDILQEPVVVAWENAKRIYQETTKALDDFKDVQGTINTKTEKSVKTLEASTNVHKLILEQYAAELEMVERLNKETQRLIEMERDATQRIDYRKFFLRTAGIDRTFDPFTNLDLEYEQGLHKYKEYLDEKYKLDLINAGQSTQARQQAEIEHLQNMRAYRRQEWQSYLQSTSSAINTISDLIEASKQKELSMAGDNAKRRERIEREYLQKQKGFAIAQAIINGALAVTNLIASVPLSVLNPATWVGIGVAAAATAAQIAIIVGQGMKNGGIVPAGYPNDTYPAMLTSGETVIPAKALSGIEKKQDIAEMLKNVTFHIEGTQLVGVFANYNRKVNSYN